MSPRWYPTVQQEAELTQAAYKLGVEARLAGKPISEASKITSQRLVDIIIPMCKGLDVPFSLLTKIGDALDAGYESAVNVN